MYVGPSAFRLILVIAAGICQVPGAKASDPPQIECANGYSALKALPEAVPVASEFRALDILGHPTIAINAQTGTIEWMTPKAQQLLEANFGRLEDPSHMPGNLQSWVSRVTPDPDLKMLSEPILRTPTVSGELRLQVRGRLREDRLVLIGISEFSLPNLLKNITEKYGLTPREAEVFYWIAQGKTNNDIGTIIGASGGTAKKHVENIFRKLGLSNRTQPTQMLRRDFGQ